MSPNRQAPKISVILIDGSFRQRFDAVDFMARQSMRSEDFELIWVEHYDAIDPRLAARLEARRGFRAICLDAGGTYHASRCFNRGLAEARGQVVALCDADVIVENDLLEGMWEDHQRCDRLVQYYHRYNEPERHHVEPVTLEHLRRTCELTNRENHGACLSVRRRWLMQINGYDEHPLFATGFHANDKDVHVRLRNLGLLVRWHPEARLYHPWHPMTGFEASRYVPQMAAVDWRGRTLQTLPFAGIDPDRRTEVPRQFQEAARYLAERDQPRRVRAARRIGRSLRTIGTLFGGRRSATDAATDKVKAAA